MENPTTQYVERDGSQIAYQVFGKGSRDIVLSFGLSSNCDLVWDVPNFAQAFESLGQYFRVILFDRRGSGQSDRLPLDALPTWEDWADDMLLVMQAAGSQKAVIYGERDGGMMALMFAAMHPQRTEALVLGNATARYLIADDYPCGLPVAVADQLVDLIKAKWGSEELVQLFQPQQSGRAQEIRMTARLWRGSMTPREAAAQVRYALSFDAREVLPALSVPTIIFHRIGFDTFPIEQGRFMADRIPNARFVELEGAAATALFNADDAASLQQRFVELLTGAPTEFEAGRALITVLFCDIVDSTRHAAELNDRDWRLLLEKFSVIVRSEISRHGGREVDTAGDGFFIVFDRPTRAVHCATAIREAVQTVNLQVRCGVHSGECAIHGEKFAGIAVHIGARVAAAATPGEVWVSETVKALAMGSGIIFVERGMHSLKGVPNQWQLYAVS